MKSRVSYTKELRDQAKVEGKGLMTMSLRLPNGELHEGQRVVDATEARFLRWACALVANPSMRPLPDLEELVQKHLGGGLS